MNQIWIKNFINKLIDAELSANEKNIAECINFKISNLPKFIYKYRFFDKEEKAIEGLKNNSVHLSFVHNFNDPFDCVSILSYEQIILTGLIKNDKEIFFNNYSDKVRNDMIKRILSGEKLSNIVFDHFGMDKKTYNKFLNRYKEEFNNIVSSLGDEFKTQFLLCCFSAILNNNLMWSHYSNSHTGFCIEYDISKLPPNSPFKHSLYPVIYTKKPLLAKLRSQDYTNSTKDMLTILNKNIDWRYEKEFRMFCPSDFPQTYVMPIKPSCLYLGNKIESDNQKKIINIAKKMEIPIKKMKLKANSFNLESYQI